MHWVALCAPLPPTMAIAQGLDAQAFLLLPLPSLSSIRIQAANNQPSTRQGASPPHLNPKALAMFLVVPKGDRDDQRGLEDHGAGCLGADRFVQFMGRRPW